MENKNSTEDLKTLRNYALGVTGFATAISTVLIQVFHFKAEPTIVCVIAFAILMLLIVYLINQAENRNAKRLSVHIDESNKNITGFGDRLDGIDKVLLDIQKSTLRTEICNEINRNPANHDTIIKMGEKYFCQLEGNWIMLDTFANWVESENEAGRKVHLPPSLLKTVDEQLSRK